MPPSPLRPVPRWRQVATLRESGADFRKFYVHSGTSTLTLRAESQEDRWVWLQALQTSKGSWEGMTPAEASALKRDTAARILSQDEAFMTYLGEVGGSKVGRLKGWQCWLPHLVLLGAASCAVLSCAVIDCIELCCASSPPPFPLLFRRSG